MAGGQAWRREAMLVDRRLERMCAWTVRSRQIYIGAFLPGLDLFTSKRRERYAIYMHDDVIFWLYRVFAINTWLL